MAPGVVRTGVELRLDAAASVTVTIVSRAFVVWRDGASETRWDGSWRRFDVRTDRDETLGLLAIVDATAGDLVGELLPDLRIGGAAVSRWQMMTAPRSVEMSPDLEARLMPLRRG